MTGEQFARLTERVEQLVGRSIGDLADKVHTFTTEKIKSRPAEQALKCRDEAAEFAADPELGEAADVLITLMSWLSLRDLDALDLLAEAHAKMDRNLARTWQQQPDGTWQHVGDAA